MKKIISIIMVALVGIAIIPKTLINERHIVLESTTSVYTKEEVDNLLSTIRTNITNNTNELTNIKSELTALQNSLKDYALKTSLNTTNSNVDNLNTIVIDNTSRIEALENSVSAFPTINIFKTAGDAFGESYMTYSGFVLDNSSRKYKSITFTSSGYWRSGLATGMTVTAWDSLDRGSGVTSTITAAGTYTIDISELDYPYVATKADSTVYGYGTISNIIIE